ncbi:MAG: preprotein translocase subunit SecY [Actinomycetaceae bacterium]|nr:preprotein translocase subunit SecY [Actinomycetaceae bacterium]MDY5854813.1 preprotein translocase subunit SecY [Arcanobacterium sp.]
MLKALASAFRTPDLRKKLLVTMLIMAIYRLGTYVPAPFVSYVNVQQCLIKTSGKLELLTMMNMFAGGGMLQLSIFALGIMPYITASIIVQLMRVVIPRFEELHKEGQTGQAKLTEYTRYVTIFLAILQSSVIASVANSALFPGCTEHPIPDDSVPTLLLIILVMTAGTGLVMWLAEIITERGVGNGMSLLIFTGIAANFPALVGTVAKGNNPVKDVTVVILMFLAITVVVVFVEQSQRRIPVQYAKRVVGRRTYGGTSTYIPIKVNMANVIPVIFASSILSIPQMVATFGDPTKGWVQWINTHFTYSSPWYLAAYAILIVFFAFFYTSITFNPEEIADNMKRYGGFIPGIRAGAPTAEYLRYVINRINWVGAIYLAIVAMIPYLVFNSLGIQGMGIGGTSIIILVGVGLQTVKDIDAQLQQRHYEGFLR